MNITITLSPEAENGRHAILWNDELSHHVAANEVQELLKESRQGLWRSQPASGAMLGARLFELFDGSAGHLDAALKEVYHSGEPLTLVFRMPFELDALPVELLWKPTTMLSERKPPSQEGNSPHPNPLPEGEGVLLPSPQRKEGLSFGKHKGEVSGFLLLNSNIHLIR